MNHVEFYSFLGILIAIIYEYIFNHGEDSILTMFNFEKIISKFKENKFVYTHKKMEVNNILKERECEPDINISNPVMNNYVSKGEYICRKVLVKIFNKPFNKARILKNPVTGKMIELDCYNDDLKLAIEYNGEQHYKFIDKFHKNKEEFYNLKYRDLIKKNLCKENNIDLIVVPFSIKHENIAEYIKSELKKINKL